MRLSFEEFNEQTDPKLIHAAAVLVNNEIIGDSHANAKDISYVSDGQCKVYGLVDDDRRLVSVASVERATWRAGQRTIGKEYDLDVLAVQPEYQRHGAGAYMLQQIERRVAALGGTMLRIYPTDASHDFYTTNGYVEDPTDEGYVFRPINPQEKRTEVPVPPLRSRQEIVAAGDVGDTVRLGAGMIRGVIGEVLMAQTYINSAGQIISEVLEGSATGGELQAILTSTDARLEGVRSALFDATERFDEYRAHITQGSGDAGT